MSKVVFSAYLDGMSRRKDRSVSLRFITQEKTSVEVMKIDEMNTDEVEELDNIDLDLYDAPKSQSQRLRSVLFVLWKQEGEEGEFKKFYKQKTEEIIQHFKNKLEDE